MVSACEVVNLWRSCPGKGDVEVYNQELKGTFIVNFDIVSARLRSYLGVSNSTEVEADNYEH